MTFIVQEALREFLIRHDMSKQIDWIQVLKDQIKELENGKK